ncbi:MAG: hypothetical protein EON54_22920 [Alcaligenaceae bacterium]|nr:MAG: hypothetical protein EON54_22920 [Alcaligenaceae bacterium]
MSITQRLHAVGLERGLREPTVRSYAFLLDRMDFLDLVDPDIQTAQDCSDMSDEHDEGAHAEARQNSVRPITNSVCFQACVRVERQTSPMSTIEMLGTTSRMR